MINKTSTEHFPWLDTRKLPTALPVYKIIARSMSLTGESIVMLHKSGSNFVVNYYIRDVVNHEEIMNNLDTAESNLLKWVVNSEITNPLED